MRIAHNVAAFFSARLTVAAPHVSLRGCMVWLSINAFIGSLHAAPLSAATSEHPPRSESPSAGCPRFEQYAAVPHPPFSTGPLKLPFQRPKEKCRTFRSAIVETVIATMTERLVDKDLARLFENCFPNTLDTAVRWVDGGDVPQAFIVTGDIAAEWLRDAANQLAPYMPLIPKDEHLRRLVLGAINTQAAYLIQAPYCNAFQPPPGSGIAPVVQHEQDQVYPAFAPSIAFECKYELDSLASFIFLSYQYFGATGDLSFIGEQWLKAVKNVLQVIDEQSLSTFDGQGQYQAPKYTFQRQTDVGTETLALGGAGNPTNANTSLIRSAFRPSDDATIFPFLIPANASMSVQLGHLATLLRKGGHSDLAPRAAQRGQSLEAAVWKHGTVAHALYGRVFAYETDGYGSHVIMDDANLPSLLSLAKIGFVSADNPVYKNTRRMVLEPRGNPYYLRGAAGSGIGGPHVGLMYAWPMSLLMRIQTTDDDEEIKETLDLIKSSTAGLGLMHESMNVRIASDYTRSWFAWANTLFGETMLDLARRKPYLIFGKGAAPYVPVQP